MTDVTVWTLSLEGLSAADVSPMVRLLEDGEVDRAAEFRVEAAHVQYVVAHALLRRLLTDFDPRTPPPDWRFSHNAHGKPRLDGGPYFNLSHCEGLVAVSISSTHEHGVDVAAIDATAPLELADELFPAVEADWLRALPEGRRAEGFLRLWTLKEAYIKATGYGLSQSLQAFGFRLDPARLAFCPPAEGPPSAWRFQQWVLGWSHIVAVASRCGTARPNFDLRDGAGRLLKIPHSVVGTYVS